MREYKYTQNAELERYSNSILKMDQINDIQEHAGNAQGVDPLANQINVANIENDNQAWNALVEENRARALLQCETIRIQDKDYLIPTGIEQAPNFIAEMEDARQTNITALRAASLRQSDPLGVTTFYSKMWKLAEANQLTALPQILDTLIYQTQYDDSNVKIFFDTMLEPGEPQHDNGGIERFGLRVPLGMNVSTAIKAWNLLYRMCENSQYAHVVHDFLEKYQNKKIVIDTMWELASNNTIILNSCYISFSKFAKRNSECSKFFLDALFKINNNIVGNNPQLEQINCPQGMLPTRALNYSYLVRRMNEDAEHRHLMLCWIKDYPRKKQALNAMWKFSIKNTQILGHSYNTFAEFALHGGVCSNLFFDTLFGVNMRRGLNNFPEMDTLRLPQEMFQSTAIGLLYILNNTSDDSFHLADVIGWLSRYRNRNIVLEDMRDLVNLNQSLKWRWRNFMVHYNNKKTHAALLR